MRQLKRRQFLKYAACGGAALASQLVPRFVLGQSMGGGRENLIVINLFGGASQSITPYGTGALGTLYRQLQPTIYPSEAAVVPVFNQSGSLNPIGVHPGLGSLRNHMNSYGAIIQNVGLLGIENRSHDDCQKFWSLGKAAGGGTEERGFLARVMDQKHWDTFQVWGLGVSRTADFNSELEQPVIVNDLGSFRRARFSYLSDEANALFHNFQDALLVSETTHSELGTRYKRTTEDMLAAIDKVQRYIVNQQVGTYSRSQIGNNLKGVAQLLRAKYTQPELGLASKQMICYTGQGGYDLHSGMLTFGPDLLTPLGANISALIGDLIAFGAWQETTLVIISEFGRSNYVNGDPTAGTEGLEHGYGSNMIVLGGSIDPGVRGEAPPVAMVADREYDALSPTTDYRSVFCDVFRRFGLSASDLRQVFDDPTFNPNSSVNLFRA